MERINKIEEEIEKIWKVLKAGLSDEQIKYRVCNHNFKKERKGNLLNYSCEGCGHTHLEYCSFIKEKNRFMFTL